MVGPVSRGDGATAAFTSRVRVDRAGVVGGEKKICGVLEGNKTTKSTKGTKGTAVGGWSSEKIGKATWAWKA